MKTTWLIVVLFSSLGLSGCRFAWSDAPTKAASASSAASVAAAPIGAAPAATDALEITYLANEGFMIAGGGRKVLIDALFGQGLAGYAVVSPTQRGLLEEARAPFTDVDAVFTTHFHDDHFNATSVLAHLTHNPQAFFFSTPQAVNKLRATGSFEAITTRVIAALPKEGERIHTGHRGIGVQLLNLHHGRGRPIENLGFIIEIAGKRILHIGDSEAESAVFQRYGIAHDRLDVAFLPFWYFEHEDLKRAIREHMQPRHIVVMHLESDQLRNRANWEKQWTRLKAEFPNANYFTQELEKKSLP